jgi:hypothetical protein
MSLTIERTSPTAEQWLHLMYGIRRGRSSPIRCATAIWAHPEGTAEWLHRMWGITSVDHQYSGSDVTAGR